MRRVIRLRGHRPLIEGHRLVKSSEIAQGVAQMKVRIQGIRMYRNRGAELFDRLLGFAQHQQGQAQIVVKHRLPGINGNGSADQLHRFLGPAHF